MKKKFLLFIAIVVILFTSQYPKEYSKPLPHLKHKRVNNYVIKIKSKHKKKNIVENQKFLKRLAWVESGGNYKTITGKYIGAYQIHTMCFKQFGYKINTDSFKLNPETFNKEKQDNLVKDILKYHSRLLRREIKQFNGKVLEVRINSKKTKKIMITKSGILAAAHLGGPGAISDLLKSNGNKNFRDGNGLPISVYLEKFSDLRVDF